MSKFITVAVTLAVILPALISCDQPPAVSEEADKKLITDMSKARAKAFNEGNAEAIAIHFTDDAILMAPGKPAQKGRTAVQAYYQSVFNEYSTVLESHYDEVDVSGHLAYGRGSAKVTIVPKKGGKPVVSTAKYLNILKRQPDGSWKTTHDIWNASE